MRSNIVRLGPVKTRNIPSAEVFSPACLEALAAVAGFAELVRLRGLLADAATLPDASPRIHGALALVTARVKALLDGRSREPGGPVKTR